MAPVAQRFGVWAPASRFFSAITDLVAVVQREVDRLCSFSSPCMHAPPPPACPLRLLLTAAKFSPSRHHQTWRWCALLPYATAVSQRQSRATCVTAQAPPTAFICDMTITPLHFACSGKVPVLLALSIALGQKQPSTFLCGETSTAPEQRRP